METCCICAKEITSSEQTVVLKEKGSIGINNASIQRGSSLITSPGDCAHVNCRRIYTKTESIAHSKSSSVKVTHKRSQLRSLQPTFNFKEHCFFCGQDASYDHKHRSSTDKEVFDVRTIHYSTQILSTCESRNDSWADVVKGRILSVSDLHAADAQYHLQCSINF